MNAPPPLTDALQGAFNRYLALDESALGELATLAGKVIAIEITGLAITLFVEFLHDGVRIHGHFDGEPDASIRATPLVLMRMGLGADRSEGLFSGEMEIRGDVELGQRFSTILERMDIDWEEQISHVTGDVIARQIGNLARGSAGWTREAVETLEQDAAEYLHEEGRMLPTQEEIETYLCAVDRLHEDVDRLEARLHRLWEHARNRKSGDGNESEVP